MTLDISAIRQRIENSGRALNDRRLADLELRLQAVTPGQQKIAEFRK